VVAIRGAPSAVRRKGKKQGRKGKKGKEGDDGRAAADKRGQHRSGEKESACGCALMSGTHGAVREKGRRAASDRAGRALARASDARGRLSRVAQAEQQAREGKAPSSGPVREQAGALERRRGAGVGQRRAGRGQGRVNRKEGGKRLGRQAAGQAKKGKRSRPRKGQLGRMWEGKRTAEGEKTWASGPELEWSFSSSLFFNSKIISIMNQIKHKYDFNILSKSNIDEPIFGKFPKITF